MRISPGPSRPWWWRIRGHHHFGTYHGLSSNKFCPYIDDEGGDGILGAGKFLHLNGCSRTWLGVCASRIPHIQGGSWDYETSSSETPAAIPCNQGMDSHCSFKFGMLFEPFATQIYNIFLGKAKFFRTSFSPKCCKASWFATRTSHSLPVLLPHIFHLPWG